MLGLQRADSSAGTFLALFAYCVMPPGEVCAALFWAHLLHSDGNATSSKTLWLDQLGVLWLLPDSLI